MEGRVKLADFVKKNEWKPVEVEVEIGTKDKPKRHRVQFVIFDWKKVKKREEDSANIFNYFIGWKEPLGPLVEKGEVVPFGAGGMSATALKYDGGFQETGHLGMLFADLRESKTKPKVIYFLKTRGVTMPVADSLDALVAG